MSFFHQTIAITDSEEEEEEDKELGEEEKEEKEVGEEEVREEEERISFESEECACYKERLSSKEEEDESEEREEEEEEDTPEEDKKRHVSFSEDVLVCPTYTREEYDREPDDAWEEREARVEEAVARLDIVVLQSDPRLLLELVRFSDHHRMVEVEEEEAERLVCDFGVYVEEVMADPEATSLNLARGDMVLTVGEQDFLSSTAGQLKHHLARSGRPRVSLTLGRPRSRVQ